MWADFIRQLRQLQSLLKKSQVKHVNSHNELDATKSLIQYYFRELRPEIKKIKLDIKELEDYFKKLHEFVNKRTLRKSYIDLLKSISEELGELEIQKECYLGDAKDRRERGSDIEQKIYQTLEKLKPDVALSYKQVLFDLSDKERVSFRGTASELREILREILNHLAPDKVIEQSEGFILEKDCNKPTMKQKVRFILMSRGLSRTQTKSAEASANLIEIGIESIASLTRSIYNSGSLATHTDFGKIKEHVVQLKMYTDAVLCELLEIHSQ